MAFQRQRVGRYALVKQLALGGQAEVFLGEVESGAGRGEARALKRLRLGLRGDPQEQRRLVQEARIFERIRHPNVVSLHEVVEAPDATYAVLDLVEGTDLRAIARRCPRGVPERVAVSLICQACAGVHAAHEARGPEGQPLGVVHRDLSPDNLLLSRLGMVKVIDFGLARITSDVQHTAPGELKGKAAYLAPEQIRGTPVDRRADVYALGVVLYELLSGVRPFDAPSDGALLQAVLHAAPAPLGKVRPGLSPKVEAAVMGAMAREPAARLPTAAALAEALGRAVPVASPMEIGTWLVQLESGEGHAEHTTILDRAPSPSLDLARFRPKPWPFVGVAAGLVLAGVVAASTLGRSEPARVAPAGPVTAPPPSPLAAPLPPVAAAPHPVVAAPPPPAPADSRPVRPHPPAHRGKEPAAAVAAPAAAAPVSGTLRFWVLPWAEVSVDGHDLGQTPVADQTLPSGTHHVTLLHGEQRRDLEVEVPASGEFVVRARFQD